MNTTEVINLQVLQLQQLQSLNMHDFSGYKYAF